MDYKVLIKLFVPEIEEVYELYIPINKYIGELCDSLSEIVNDLSKVYPVKKDACLCNRYTGTIYKKTYTVRQTDIRNGTELALF